jgi:hypothetical protein
MASSRKKVSRVRIAGIEKGNGMKEQRQGEGEGEGEGEGDLEGEGEEEGEEDAEGEGGEKERNRVFVFERHPCRPISIAISIPTTAACRHC